MPNPTLPSTWLSGASESFQSRRSKEAYGLLPPLSSFFQWTLGDVPARRLGLGQLRDYKFLSCTSTPPRRLSSIISRFQSGKGWSTFVTSLNRKHLVGCSTLQHIQKPRPRSRNTSWRFVRSGFALPIGGSTFRVWLPSSWLWLVAFLEAFLELPTLLGFAL